MLTKFQKYRFLCLIILMAFLCVGASAEKNQKTGKKGKKSTAPQSELLADSDSTKNSLIATSNQQVENVEKIQSDLQQIISRTQQLQTQVIQNRSEIKGILERAQIHQRILKGITVPKPIQSKDLINPDAIVAREKMRLIAQQAQQAQEHLKAIQSARFVKSISKAEPPPKAS